MHVWIIRYGEIFLKGKNRHIFEKRLVYNIKCCLSKNNLKFLVVILKRNRILVYSEDNCSCLRYVFGITSISKALEINQDINDMEKAALNFYTKGSFRISSQRIEKDFKYNSEQINKKVGAFIVKEKNAPVKLETPDVNIGIEIFNNKAYVFNSRIKGFGGLPVGIEGNVALLLEDKKSLLAGILMLKRGCSITIIGKNNLDTEILEKFCYGSKLSKSKTIPKDAKAVIVNDTLENIKKRNFKLPVLRPLIGYEANDLEKWLS